MKFLLFSGSLRQGQYSEHVAQFVLNIAQQRPNTEWEWIDPRKLGLTYQDEGEAACPPELREKVEQADGIIIVSPEYNHGYPGTIKYLLDLNLKAYKHKPVGFVGVSDGAFGGTRMIEALVGVVKTLGLVVLKPDVNFSHCKEEITDGRILNPEPWTRRVNTLLEEFLWMATVLKEGREKYPIKK